MKTLSQICFYFMLFFLVTNPILAQKKGKKTGWKFNESNNKGELIGVLPSKKHGKLANPNPKGKIRKALKHLLLPKMQFVPSGTYIIGDSIDRLVAVGASYVATAKVDVNQYCAFLNDWSRGRNYEDLEDTLKLWLSPDLASIGISEEKNSDGRLYYKPISDFNAKPIMNVTWLGATAYCQWLTKQVNDYRQENGLPILANYRLPAEAEWEYIAQAKDKIASNTANEDTQTLESALAEIENFTQNGGEWCFDIYTDRSEINFTDLNPVRHKNFLKGGEIEPLPITEKELKSVKNIYKKNGYDTETINESSTIRVIRGDFINQATSRAFHYSIREMMKANQYSPNVGFRVVMTDVRSFKSVNY